jgi:hypothetical protein
MDPAGVVFDRVYIQAAFLDLIKKSDQGDVTNRSCTGMSIDADSVRPEINGGLCPHVLFRVLDS